MGVLSKDRICWNNMTFFQQKPSPRFNTPKPRWDLWVSEGTPKTSMVVSGSLNRWDRWYIITQLAVYTPYIPLIVLANWVIICYRSHLFSGNNRNSYWNPLPVWTPIILYGPYPGGHVQAPARRHQKGFLRFGGTKFENWWGFPKMVVPPNHPILIGFSIINHPFWGPTPIFGNPLMELRFFPSPDQRYMCFSEFCSCLFACFGLRIMMNSGGTFIDMTKGKTGTSKTTNKQNDKMNVYRCSYLDAPVASSL